MAYTLKFSDLTKTDSVTVPDYPPGINTVDTSLNLVGRGYPNYGEKIAENFLHLLENFSSPVPPENPIEGQLWYDTSDPSRKVLRVMDGTATSAHWPSANGIYQQNSDPKLNATTNVKKGDIWVDTSNNQMKIFTSDDWIVVGPILGSGIEKTGAEVYELVDSVNPTVKKRVILNWSGGYVVSVISGYPAFTPLTYPSGMEGFGIIKPGITLTIKQFSSTPATLYGTADNANKLGSFSATNYLLKNDQSILGQKITGKVVFETPATTGQEGRDGVVIRIAGSAANEFVQFYKSGNDAVIANNVTDGGIVFKTKGSTVNTFTIEKNAVAVNTATTTSSPTFDVYGTARVSSTLTVKDLVTDSVSANKSISAATISANTVTVSNNLTMNGKIVAGSTSTYDIGSSTVPFKNAYVDKIYASNIIGLQGISLNGDISVLSSGTYNVGSLSNPFKNVYAQNVYATNYSLLPGTLQLFAGNTVPADWLKCDGSTVSTSTYANLYAVIGTTYGTTSTTGTFYLPNLFTTSTMGGTSTFATTYYIIKT
jgi:hypothetical protein